MQPVEQNILASTVIVGILAAGCVTFAFLKPFIRFCHGSRLFADALGAGIWVRAVGTILAGSSLIIATVAGVTLLPLYVIGWLAVIGGYYLHFCAWRAAYFDLKRVFVAEVAIIFFLFWIAAFGFFHWINP